MTTEKFLVYFFLIAFYTAYTQFTDAPVAHGVDQGQAVAGISAAAETSRQ